MTRQELLDRLADQMLETLFMSREKALAELATWHIEPQWYGDEVIGAVLRRGPELHIAIFKSVPIPRWMMAEVLRPQMDLYGFVTTRTPRHLESQHRHNQWLGFKAVKEDEYDVHYRLERDQCRLPL